MSRRARELELLFLTMFAAVPLYATHVVSLIPLILFHAVMAGIAVRIWLGRGPELIPAAAMRALALAYIVFYAFDATLISRSAIAASTHLVLFIAVYQPIEAIRSNNYAQRLLTTALIFIASLSTATDITIVLFVIAFTFVMFRQLMYISHVETVRTLDRPYAESASGRAALFYLGGTVVIGALLFPALPRIRNPLVQGPSGPLTNATTGLSDTIDFTQPRSSVSDPMVVARVWMSQETLPFFTPLRLRGAVYDHFRHNEWLQSRERGAELRSHNGTVQIGQPAGFTRTATVEQRFVKDNRLFLPTQTYAISGLPFIWEGPRHAYSVAQARRDLMTYDVAMAWHVDPMRDDMPRPNGYPVTPAVLALARSMVGDSTAPLARATKIESYMSSKFRYLADPSQIGHPMTVDEFLLKERRGHCEYFAAGMVALLSALDVPARVVGGFYGGQFNPLTGYIVIRREDAHAWVEVWDGNRWETFDPTPSALRPGGEHSGLLRAYASALGDSVNYFWDRYVLTYGLGDQIALAADLIARARVAATNAQQSAGAAVRGLVTRRAAAALGMLLVVTIVSLWIMRRRRSVFSLLAAHLASRGIEVGPAMTMREALALLRERHPVDALALEPLIDLYEAERFSANSEPRREAAIRKELARLNA